MANDKEKFDVSSFLSSFDKEFESSTQKVETAVPEAQEEPKPEVKETLPAEPEKETPVSEENVEKPAEVSEEVKPTVEQPVAEPVKEQPVETSANDQDVHKRNEAFKRLREEKEKLESEAKVLDELAAQFGITRQELVGKIKDERTAKEAQKQGIPVEQFKVMQQLQQEVNTIKQKAQQDAFNYEAERLVQKYNIPSTQVNDVFAKIGQLGIDVLANPKLLEVAYKALNYDVALQQGRQAQLQETKKRRETTASPTLGTKGTNVDTSQADVDAEIDAFLKEKFGK